MLKGVGSGGRTRKVALLGACAIGGVKLACRCVLGEAEDTGEKLEVRAMYIPYDEYS
jgi:hypothetical protein